MDEASLGRRIAVLGPSGSGKSTFARQLGGLLNLPVIELDALFHRPNWEETPRNEFREIVEDRLTELDDAWVCDGNYGTTRDIIFPKADTIIWLRLPFRTVYPRLVKRTLTRAWSGEELWNGNKESFRAAFLSRDSMLLWGISHWGDHHRHVERDLERIEHNAKLITLRSTRDVGDLLTAVEKETAAQ